MNRTQFSPVAALATLMAFGWMAGSACADDVTDIALQVGITPEGLAAAGLTSTDAETALTLLAAESGAISSLASAATNAESSALALDDLALALWRDPESSSVQQEYNDEAARLEAANASIQDARATLFEAGVDEFAADVSATLTTIQTTQGFGIPPEYCATARTGEEWQALSTALSAEQRALRTDEEVDEESADLLLDVRSEPETASAIVNLEQELPDIQQVFEESGG